MTTRVAYVCADPGVPVFGTKGASVHVQEIIRAWRARGAEVRLYVARTGDRVPADLADVPVVVEKVDGGDRELPPGARTAQRERNQLEAGRRLAEHVVADGADVVYERYSLFSTALADVVGATGAQGVLEVNAPLVDEQRTHRHLVDEAGALRVLRRQVAVAASVACVSAPVADWVRRHMGADTAGGRVVVTPNGVNTDRITPVVPDADGPATVLFVGTLKPWHGVEVLLEAAALAREAWTVRLVGDGPQAPVLRDLAGRLGLDVDFRGAVAPEEVPAQLAGAEVAVAPYPAAEADQQYFSPLKLYEYAAAALPVVASDTGQVGTVVEDGVTGLLVPPSDPEALARAVDALVTDRGRARELGRAARERAVREHSWHRVLDRALAPLTPEPGRVDPWVA
jgi:glycosyltransferase involved in cell wall biosynthesis